MSKKEALSMETLEQVGGGIAIEHKSFDTNAADSIFSREGLKPPIVADVPRPFAHGSHISRNK